MAPASQPPSGGAFQGGQDNELSGPASRSSPGGYSIRHQDSTYVGVDREKHSTEAAAAKQALRVCPETIALNNALIKESEFLQTLC